MKYRIVSYKCTYLCIHVVGASEKNAAVWLGLKHTRIMVIVDLIIQKYT
jgi:hypothetical protein